MNDKNYIITMALSGMLLIVSLVHLAGTTDAFIPKNNTVQEKIQIPEFEAIPEQTIECTLCHKQPENIIKHINGGNYCASCHGIELHDLHKKSSKPDLTCKTCHRNSTAVEIPEKLQDHETICDTCHGYPDPLSPSFGNLITIHVTKGHTCDICHVQDIGSLHKQGN